MLLLDVSNIMYTGASARFSYFGESSDFKIRSIPYFFQQVAAYYSKDTNMVAVFEKVGKMPALARTDGYKSGRSRNPLVEWEITALKELLKYIGFPILEVEGQEADYVINNYCRLNRDKEHIYILSADQDLASNVRSGSYVTELLSYSTVSYNVKKHNFKSITGVDYNFMNLHKMLLGCKSDKIKPFPQGREIYHAYFKSLEGRWKRIFSYQPGIDSTSQYDDDLVLPYATYDSFIDWFIDSRYYTEDNLKELQNRRLLIEGPQFDVARPHQIDWRSYNDLMATMNMNTTASNKAVRTGSFSKKIYDDVMYIFRQAQNTNVSMFEELPGDSAVEEVGDISNILGLLDLGGDL